MRLAVLAAVAVLAALAGLYVYAELLEPETRMIEQEALRGAEG